jgi:hypothetical protein
MPRLLVGGTFDEVDVIGVRFRNLDGQNRSVYDNLDDCVKAEQTMRSEYTRVYNQSLEWAIANPKDASYPKSQPLMQKRIGVQTIGTCVPTASRGDDG